MFKPVFKHNAHRNRRKLPQRPSSFCKQNIQPWQQENPS